MRTPTMGVGLHEVQRVDVGAEEYHSMRPDPTRFQPAYIDPDGTPFVPFMSCSFLKAFKKSRESCWEEHVARIVTKPPTKAMLFGIALERIVMYNEQPNVIVAPQEVLQRRKKANSDTEYTYAKSGAPWTEWCQRMIAEHGPSVQLVKQEEFDSDFAPLLMAIDTLKEDPVAAKLLWGEAETHVTVTGIDDMEDVPVPVKMQLDFVHCREILVDLKSCRPDALESESSLMSYVKEQRHHWQSWFYRHVWAALTGEVWPFVFVYVSSERPFRVVVKQLAHGWDETAEMEIRDQIVKLKHAWKDNSWKREGFGTVTELPCPRYLQTGFEDEIQGRTKANLGKELLHR